MRIVYLHGFASGPQSSKAQFFAAKFREMGVPFDVPELDQGNFEALTISAMLEVVNKTVDQPVPGNGFARERITLIGSSLGGFIAGLFAERCPERVERLVLLAPALQFAARWKLRFTEWQFADWKSLGRAPFYHYGHKREEYLGYSFVEDAANYHHEPDFPHPGLILHGTEDPVVPVASSRDFAARHANVELVEFPSGHELTDVLEPVWTEAAAFLARS
jgi:uncharacterized protein